AVARSGGVSDSLVDVATRQPFEEMMRQLGEVRPEVPGVQPFEHLGHPAMQPNTLEVAEIPVERLADQRVGEAVAADRAGHRLDDPRRDRLFEDSEGAPPP